MRRIYAALTVATLSLSLMACAIFTPTQGSLQDTVAAITVWTDFVQPAIKVYGNWPDCAPDKPLVKLCRDHAYFTNTIQPLAWAAHTAIQAAGPVLAGQVPDTGQIIAAYDAIQTARNAMAKTPVASSLPAPAPATAAH
jgi:hypothetical protein